MDTMDLQVAIIAHLNWKSKLSDFFYGVEELNANDVPDYNACEFGKWLYAIGMEEFRDFSEMSTLERIHKEVHEDIKRMLAMPKDVRTSAEGKAALASFKSKCDTMVGLIEQLKARAERV